MAKVTIIQRGSNVNPSTCSPGTTAVAHCSFKFKKVTALPGVGKAHSGLSGSKKNETSARLKLLYKGSLNSESGLFGNSGHAFSLKCTASM